MYTVKKSEIFDVIWTSTDLSINKLQRLAEYTINDDGYLSNKYDTVYFSQLTNEGYTLSQLKSRGYKTICLEISISVKEINDGYQYIAIYDDTTSSSSQLAYYQFEHGSLRKDTNYATYKFTFKFNLDVFSKSYFVIRYNASGFMDDNWMNKNVIINGYISQIWHSSIYYIFK